MIVTPLDEGIKTPCEAQLDTLDPAFVWGPNREPQDNPCADQAWALIVRKSGMEQRFCLRHTKRELPK